MMNDKVRTLIEKLLEKTLQKSVKWDQTSRTSEFFLALPSGQVTTDKWEADDNEEYIDLAIYNNAAIKIEYIRASRGNLDYAILEPFYSAVYSAFYMVDETLDEMLQTLESDKVAGEQKKGPHEQPF